MNNKFSYLNIYLNQLLMKISQKAQIVSNNTKKVMKQKVNINKKNK